MKAKIITFSLLWAALMLPLASCQGIQIQQATTALTASGTISADSTRVASEIGGKILEIKVNKGDTVKAGDILFTLDSQILQAQHDQAAAAVQVAQAAVDGAKQKLATAQAQYNLAVQSAQMQDSKSRTSVWLTDQPAEFSEPGWYFQKTEQIAALQSEIDAAQTALTDELANLNKELQNASNEDFIAAEKRLAVAEAAYQNASKTLDQAKAAKNNTALTDAAQKIMDAALSELNAAQDAYTKILSSTAASNVREARARVAVAQARLNNAQDALNQLMSGDQSLQIQVAQTGVDAATSAVSQAQASLVQAQAALNLLNVQLAKTTVLAPTTGIVLSRPVNPGEISAAGATVVEIGTLDQVKLTVYLPEDQYGKISLVQQVKVSVDSFPERTFTGNVTYISNQAEFTPRNVQTVESRSTTVYAIEITILNPDFALKDGMPADATF
jgi:HlyD family secretion protein